MGGTINSLNHSMWGTKKKNHQDQFDSGFLRACMRHATILCAKARRCAEPSRCFRWPRPEQTFRLKL